MKRHIMIAALISLALVLTSCQAVFMSSDGTIDIVGNSTAGTVDFTIGNYTGGNGSGVSDHGGLTGLGDDDHSQYILHTDLDSKAELDTQITDDDPLWDSELDSMAELDTQIADGSALWEQDFDAKGDLLAGTGADTSEAFPVGADGLCLVADSGESSGLAWASRGNQTTAAMTIYVDIDAVGSGNGTSWANAFTSITDAWDSLPTIIAHDIEIYVRSGSTAYNEQVDIEERYVVGTVLIEGEYNWNGECEANVGGAGEIKDTGEFAGVVVGDHVYVIDKNGANNRVQNYDIGLVDDITNIPDRIGTDMSVTPSTNWEYTIVRTEIDAQGTEDYGFSIVSLDNVTVQGFYIDDTDSYALRGVNSRYIVFYNIITNDCDRGVSISKGANWNLRDCYIQATDSSVVLGAGEISFINIVGGVLSGSGSSYGAYAYRQCGMLLDYIYLEDCLYGVWGRQGCWIYAVRMTIENTVTQGIRADFSGVEKAYVTNNASTAETTVNDGQIY